MKANQAKMTVEELEVVARRGMLLQDEKGRLFYAKEQGRLEGDAATIKWNSYL